MTPLAALFRLDGRLLLGRGLFRIAVLFSIVAAAAAAASSTGGAFERFARGAAASAPLAAAFGALLGAASLSADAQSGALRAVLLRPIGRFAVVRSRAVWLVLAELMLFFAGLAAAALVARASGPFSAVVHGANDAAYELISAADITVFALKLAACAAPGLLAAPLIGLAVGACTDDPSLASLAALAIVLGPELYAAVGGGDPIGWWGGPGRTSLAILAELATGVQTRQDSVAGVGFAAKAVLLPAAWGVAATAIASLRMSRRDVAF